ncbi:heme exporter protein CcmB [Duganella sp. CY15W]|uniref:heme exporter protein CcmB n=1 Tax=Duganella sp. CY15W TaxID=2692172 RepID=UPI0013715CC1|nr:heme exporter protein CcmB [Duganella sp. CY15W]MYM29121.1 heme exporter protein CcmB [Duganella sp. CY15W]
MVNALLQVIRRDLLLAFRRRTDVLGTLVFFVIVCTLFPLGLGPQPALLRTLAPGVLWVAALLASTLALNRLFGADYADGTLEQLLLSPEPLVLIVAGKIVAHWLISGLPLVLLTPLLALQFDLDASATIALILSLLVGTPALSLVGSIGAALTLDVRGGGVLVALLVLPLYAPVLIFGAGAASADAGGTLVEANLLLLGGLLAAAAALAPWATASALRISLE